MRLSLRSYFAAMMAVGFFGFCSDVSWAESITGAGSSFAAPVYQTWGDAASNETGLSVNYQSVGSSAGQNQVIAGTVDFGASDAPLTGAKIDEAHLFQFPTVMGGIVPVINIPGVKSATLKLNGAVLAGIYAGDITDWNDQAIVALNPGLKLPDMAIAPIHRADGSGTTFVFTSYLVRSSARWKENQGAAPSVAWPGGLGARGNDGVAATVKNTEGAIGYVEFAYANRNHLTTVLLRNRAGESVEASQKSFAQAAASADWAHADHFAVDLLDTEGHGAWPVVSATYVLVPLAPADAERSKAVKKFFTWSFKNGDKLATDLDYVTLPEDVKEKILASWK